MKKLVLSLMMLGLTAQAAPSNQELKIGISQEFENLNPIIMTMAATTYMELMVNRPITIMDANAKWVPGIVKSIPTLENGAAKFVDVAGKKTLITTWEILDNAKWGDGEPVICADIELMREIGSSDNVSVGEKQQYTQMAKIEWDPKTPKKCVITYDRPRWDYYTLGTVFPIPSHLEKAVWDKYGKQKEGYEKNSNFVKNPTNPGLYDGAYVISDVKLGDHVSFVPNKNFFGPAPKIQNVIVKLLPNTGTMEANLRSGTIDMISTLGLPLDQALSFEKKVKSEHLPYSVDIVPSFTYEHIDVNLDNPILKDVRVRKALMFGMNREDLVKALFEGRQQVATSHISPKDPWYTEDPKFITKYPYSKRQASKLLDEAGWKTGKDGIREKGGQRLSLVFMTTAGDKTRELVQTVLQEQLKQVGIEIVLKNQPAKVFFGDTTLHRKFPALAMYAWTSSPENTPRSTVHSTSIPSEKNGFSGENYPGWNNASVDKDCDTMDTEFDAKKRKELSFDIEKQYTAELPVLPLYYRADISVVPANLKGYKMTGHQFYETQSVEKWSM